MPDDLDEIKNLLAREDTEIRRAFMRFVRQVREPGVLSGIVDKLQDGNINGALAIMGRYISDFADELPKSFVRAARSEMQRLAPAVGQTSLDFNVGDPAAAKLMRRSKLEFITNFTDKQRDSVRSALADSLDRGEGEKQAAKRIKSSIGLTENQYKAVDNYRQLLENSSAEALQRDLRDKRSDRPVQSAIDRGDVLSDTQIDRLVDAYGNNMLNYRARTIARTESHRATSRARHEAQRQALKRARIRANRATRRWNTILDGRERDTHEAMNQQTRVGFDRPFLSPSGAELLYPGDPDAPAEEVVGCRCVVTLEIKA